MSGTYKRLFHRTLHSSFLPDRILPPQLGALLLVLLAAVFTAACGTSAQAGGTSNSRSLILSGKLPVAIADESYNAVLSVSGGVHPYHFRVKSGSLPEGLTLSPATGSISGAPDSQGSYIFEVAVTDASHLDEGVQMFALHVGSRGLVKVSVSPASVTMVAQQKQQFTASVSGSANTAVSWSATAGSIDAKGLYTAPASPQANIVVTAASQASPQRTAQAVITVNQPHTQQLVIATASLPQGQAGTSYRETFSATGGSQPYSWSISAGQPPSGITLTSDGTLSGLSGTAGTSSFTVSVNDSTGLSAQRDFFLNIVPSVVKVSVSPASATMVAQQKQQFSATVTGTSNPGVIWSASVGSVSATGLYTAPTVKSPANATITATSQADSTQSASATLTVDPVQPLQITTSSLPQGQQGDAYTAVLAATGGTQPYTWSISAGQPPAGITLTPAGTLSGLPGSSGASTFTVSVQDSTGLSGQHDFSVVITPGSNFDGPAELPRVTVSSSMASTPAPGNTISVNAGGAVQTAVNNSSCGDTIELQAGATFTGTLTFPAKACDDNHWIIVRTSAPDSALPAEGQRITPCYAGVASLPGRPQYPCSNPQNVMARLVSNGATDGPIIFHSAANHYRFIGLEITRAAGIKGSPSLVTPVQNGTADHIVIDRSWVHGTPQDDTRAGFFVSGVAYAAIVDSYFSDFHCTSVTGTCTDSHTIMGGTRNFQDGPYKIEDNFIEASGEGILFGGGPASTTPSDIVIRRNHFFKPLQWRKGAPNFTGGVSGDPFIVKNHLELKNATRVLIEANLMENSWGGFSQTGYGILLTPLNQRTSLGTNVCPVCQVTDVTVRYTHIAHAGGGMQLVTSISSQAPALAGARWSIHDVVMDDISVNYTGQGRLFEVQNGWPVNPLNTVTINHITGFPDPTGGILFIGNNQTNPIMYGFVFTNNVATAGAHPIWNSVGATSCAGSDVPITVLSKCFSSYTFSHNALIAVPSNFPSSSWPSGNFFAPDPTSFGFVRYNGGIGGNYHLQPNSPYTNLGSDGRTLGADMDGLDAALAGVE